MNKESMNLYSIMMTWGTVIVSTMAEHRLMFNTLHSKSLYFGIDTVFFGPVSGPERYQKNPVLPRGLVIKLGEGPGSHESGESTFPDCCNKMLSDQTCHTVIIREGMSGPDCQ